MIKNLGVNKFAEVLGEYVGYRYRVYINRNLISGGIIEEIIKKENLVAIKSEDGSLERFGESVAFVEFDGSEIFTVVYDDGSQTVLAVESEEEYDFGYESNMPCDNSGYCVGTSCSRYFNCH